MKKIGVASVNIASQSSALCMMVRIGSVNEGEVRPQTEIKKKVLYLKNLNLMLSKLYAEQLNKHLVMQKSIGSLQPIIAYAKIQTIIE